MYHFFIFVFVIVALCTQKSHAIVNGKELLNSQRPEIAMLLLYRNNSEKELIHTGRCTGVAISDFLVLTAGHCLTGEFGDGKNDAIGIHRFTENGKSEVIAAEDAFTQYIPEDFKKKIDEQNVGAITAGCVAREKPILQNNTPDLALLKFPPKTFKKWAQINFAHTLTAEEPIEFLGYGVKQSSIGSATAILPMMEPLINDLSWASNKIWRSSEKRVAFIASPLEAFADLGDSGAPVFSNGNVVAIINRVDEKCETEFGSDYAIMNTATVLSSSEALDFFTAAIDKLIP